MLYKVVLTFESVDEILKCDHSNEICRTVHYIVVFIMLYKVVPSFGSVDEGVRFLSTLQHFFHSFSFNFELCYL